MKNEKVWKIAMTGVFAALSYVVFTFLQIKIWLPRRRRHFDPLGKRGLRSRRTDSRRRLGRDRRRDRYDNR